MLWGKLSLMKREGRYTMLREIYCEQFYQKHIRFNDGLSVILGTDTGDNSIGKSTFLLIVDYALGGNTYSKADDIIRNVGSHDIFFSFEFDEQAFYFCRNSIDAQTVWECSNGYKKLKQITLAEYSSWLNTKYGIELPDLNFRNAVGRYTRVYGKNNCDEKHPLHYTPTEKSEKASIALLKLFNLYYPLKEVSQQLEQSESALEAYKKAQSLAFIPKITKIKSQKNEKDIAELSAQIENLSYGLEKGLMDVDSEASEQAIYIKNQLSRARRFRNKLKSHYGLLQENGN